MQSCLSRQAAPLIVDSIHLLDTRSPLNSQCPSSVSPLAPSAPPHSPVSRSHRASSVSTRPELSASPASSVPTSMHTTPTTRRASRSSPPGAFISRSTIRFSVTPQAHTRPSEHANCSPISDTPDHDPRPRTRQLLTYLFNTDTRRNSRPSRMFSSSRYFHTTDLPLVRNSVSNRPIQQRNLNNAFAYDLVPAPSVIVAALKAARRVNDFPTAVRVFEGASSRTHRTTTSAC